MNIIMYGADWCNDTTTAKELLEINNINYIYHDVDDPAQGEAYSQIVMKINDGKRIVPTLLIKGIPLTNPSASKLEESLGINLKASQKAQTPQVCTPNFDK